MTHRLITPADPTATIVSTAIRGATNAIVGELGCDSANALMLVALGALRIMREGAPAETAAMLDVMADGPASGPAFFAAQAAVMDKVRAELAKDTRVLQ